MSLQEIKQVSILGCGWYGSALAKSLIGDGFLVKGSSTRADKLSELKAAGIVPFEVRFESDSDNYLPEFFVCDLLVICIPPKRKSDEAGSYPKKIAKIISAALAVQVPRVLFISSTGVYGDENRHFTEADSPQPSTISGKAILEAEEILRKQDAFQASILRFGGLVGPDRDPGRFFAGKKDIPNGQAPVNIIHLQQCIEVTKAIIQKNAFGFTFNACSDEHPQKQKFYTEAAAKSGLALPEFRDELKEWKIVSSIHLDTVLGFALN